MRDGRKGGIQAGQVASASSGLPARTVGVGVWGPPGAGPEGVHPGDRPGADTGGRAGGWRRRARPPFPGTPATGPSQKVIFAAPGSQAGAELHDGGGRKVSWKRSSSRSQATCTGTRGPARAGRPPRPGAQELAAKPAPDEGDDHPHLLRGELEGPGHPVSRKTKGDWVEAQTVMRPSSHGRRRLSGARGGRGPRRRCGIPPPPPGGPFSPAARSPRGDHHALTGRGLVHEVR